MIVYPPSPIRSGFIDNKHKSMVRRRRWYQFRRARGQISLTEQFKTQAKVEGQWTVFGLAQELGVHRNWLYTRILKGTLPATRHSVTGHYLIADEPEVLATLRAQRDRCCYHSEGTVMTSSKHISNTSRLLPLSI